MNKETYLEIRDEYICKGKPKEAIAIFNEAISENDKDIWGVLHLIG